MHEMSIAQSIVKIASDYAQQENAKAISEVELEIGTLAGIEFGSLEFALEASKEAELFKNVNFIINKVQAKGSCFDCNCEFDVVNLFDACPKCKSYSIALICGKEMRVKSLVVE